jgi:glycosyltransferase involved in cell wall biosynthesis
MKTCVIIPVYNHESALPVVVKKIAKLDLPCILVNDGSSPECTAVLNAIAAEENDWISVIHRPENGGKGAAVIEGFKFALFRGFTHALQLDADGQHNIGAIPAFLSAGSQHPDAMILGKPTFDASAPKSRLYGRRITNFWIAVNTLSFAIGDGMCGFRLYPLAVIGGLLTNNEIAQRMDFDIDIVVRLYWQGVNPINLPVEVNYPLDGISHFRMLEDNIMISAAHARLFFGMLTRIPQLLKRHWH